MSLKANFEQMAIYNQWMNESIYNAALQLTDAELAQDRGAFFGSIIGTLNHILVGDTLWLKRFAGHPVHFLSLEYVRNVKRPNSLDATVFSKFSELQAARVRMDDVILAFSKELTEEVISQPLSYNNIKNQPARKNFGYLIQHFFNHQTHHRGQITTLLSQAGIDVGVTDLLKTIPDV